MRSEQETKIFIEQVKNVQASLLKKQVDAYNNEVFKFISDKEVEAALEYINETIDELFHGSLQESIEKGKYNAEP